MQKTILIFIFLTAVVYPSIQIPEKNISPIAQKDASCGYHVVVNAKVIDELLEGHRDINSTSVKKQAEKYQSLIGKSDLEIYEILAFAEKLSVKKIYFLQINLDHVSLAGTDQYVTSNLQEELALLFHKHQNTRIHCICNTGGHWILISIVKQNNQIFIYHMDSGNTQNISAQAEKFVQYIKNILIKA